MHCAAPEMFFNCLPRKITSVTAHLRNSPENVVFFFPSKNFWLKIVTKEQGHHYGVVVPDKEDLTSQPSRTKLVSWKQSPSLSWQPGLPKLVGRTQSCVCLSHTLSHYCRKASVIMGIMDTKPVGRTQSYVCLIVGSMQRKVNMING